jgi:hypothetical protein
MFAHVKESEASKIDNPRPVDLSPECLSMMEKLMLAQAQVGGCCKDVCLGLE